MTDKQAQHNIWARVVEDWSAVVLGMAALACVGMFLTALGAGSHGLAALAAGAAVVLGLASWMLVRAGATRKQAESTTIVYAPDFPAYVLDVDALTGVRTRHLG